jgi:hypothetical protein
MLNSKSQITNTKQITMSQIQKPKPICDIKKRHSLYLSGLKLI